MSALRGGPHRLAAGGLIERESRISFRFDRGHFAGHPGDTLASALLANGVRLVGRSFKYHRPRGVLSAGAEEPNALVELRAGDRREPNTRATVVEIFEGLEARSQNRFPSLRFDLGAINGLLGPFIPAGFYYKTFMWPAAFWERLYEPLIRRAAGLGRAAPDADPDAYERCFLFCDVLVIGAGPAGLMAALAAGRAGARVVLADEDFRLGGRLLAERAEIGGRSGPAWAEEVAGELASLANVRLLPRTTVFGVYDGGTYAAVERVADHLPVPPPFTPRQRLWRIVAKRAVLAAGAIERGVVFPGNDRPGVMLAGAVRAYLNRFAVAPGARAVVFSANDDAARTAADLAACGVAVAAVVDARPEPPPAVAAAAAAAGAPLLAGAVLTRAHGGARLTGASVRRADGGSDFLGCDLIAVSGGWSPTIHLTSHLGARPHWDEARLAFLAGEPPPGMAVVGAAAGRMETDACLAQGAAAGLAAAAAAGFAGVLPELPDAPHESAGRAPLWRVKAPGKAFVDFQNDVTEKDLALANREGYGAAEHAKRYTTLGMATDQGKTGNLNGLAILAELRGEPLAALAPTTFRPPYTPVSFGALAGRARGPAYRPLRLTPSHAWATEWKAVFVESGPWLRAAYFPEAGEHDWQASVTREVHGVRRAVGLCDVSTLGKIDVQGADAASFLERVCLNRCSRQPLGRVRYLLMLREDGFVLDDGTATRLGPEHFLLTASTAHVAHVVSHLEWCREALWPELDVAITDVTEDWAQFAVAGPRAREVMARAVDPGFDLSNDAFPAQAAAEVRAFGGIPARLFRISFSGELGYEIAVPAGFGDAAVRALMILGAAQGIVPYGLEAMGTMRIEKGFPAGPEINGQTTVRDLGFAKMMPKEGAYLGRAMAARPALVDPERPALVGLRPRDRSRRLAAGAHFLVPGAGASLANDLGFVSSATFSPTLGHAIGLGFLQGGLAHVGKTMRAADPLRGSEIEVEICPPCFVDPAGERAHG